MKNTSIALLCTIILILIGCKKEEATIDYPQNGDYGLNVLSLPDSSMLDPNLTYSLNANLSNNASLTIEMINHSDFSLLNMPIWFFNSARNIGWTISDYNMQHNTQVFEANKSGKLDLEILFPNSCIVEMNYYENGGTLNKTKYLFW
jgi:hypothetical protein